MISLTLTNEAVHDKVSDLGLSVFIGNFKRVKKLLKKKDINSRFTNNDSLLHICAHNEDSNMFYFLITHGCDYTHVNNNGDTCLHIIALVNNLYCLDVISRFNISKIINVVNKEGDTALHISIKNGFFHVFSVLLNAGADPHIKDAFDMDCFEMVDILKKKQKFYEEGTTVYSSMYDALMKGQASK